MSDKSGNPAIENAEKATKTLSGPSKEVVKNVLEEVSDKILIATLPTYADKFKGEYDIKPVIDIRKNGVEVHIRGNTYPYKEIIKKNGYKWSSGAWYKWFPILNHEGEQIKHIYDALLEAIEDVMSVMVEVIE